jgi:hypothetical protein
MGDEFTVVMWNLSAARGEYAGGTQGELYPRAHSLCDYITISIEELDY